MIAIVGKNSGIGLKKTVPFSLLGPGKIKEYYDKYTIGGGNNAIIMGRKTELQFPTLPKRDTLILSRTQNKNKKHTFKSLNEIKNYGKKYNELWILGGEEIFNYCIHDHDLKMILVTEIGKDVMSNCFFPEIPLSFKLASNCRHKNEFFTYRHKIYMKKDDNYFIPSFVNL